MQKESEKGKKEKKILKINCLETILGESIIREWWNWNNNERKTM